MTEDEYTEQTIRKLLRKKDKVEARLWFSGNDQQSLRGIGELTLEDSMSLVEELYTLGALEVFVMEILKNSPYESTDTVIVLLPQDSTKRSQLFRWSDRHTSEMGLTPDKDIGQSHLLIWFD